MKIMTRYAAGALMMGAFLSVGGLQQANAADCSTSAVTIASLGITAATPFVCIQQDKTWTLTATDLPGNAEIFWTFQNVGGLDEHTVTVSSNSTFLQGATYTLDYNIAVNTPGPVFDQVTGGMLLGGNQGVATLDKSFVSNGNPITPIHATVATPFVNEPVTGGATSINTTDSLFVDTSPVLGFANTFEEAVPEPATLLVLGTALVGVGLVRRRRTH